MGAAEERPGEKNVTRREILRRAGLLGSGALVGDAMLAWHASPSWAQLIERAAAVNPAGTTYQDIDHFVFLMMENRSYDHYFGAYHQGRGFDDHPKKSLGAFAQEFPTQAANQPVGGNKVVPKNELLPFHLDSRAGFECTDDLTHDWGPMHDCWNGGKMDSWVNVHTYATRASAAPRRWATTRVRICPFYWALADNFTLCDAYHCSIMGPTHPNRIMQLSGTIDPAGRSGRPGRTDRRYQRKRRQRAERLEPAAGRRCRRCCRTRASPGRSTRPATAAMSPTRRSSSVSGSRTTGPGPTARTPRPATRTSCR